MLEGAGRAAGAAREDGELAMRVRRLCTGAPPKLKWLWTFRLRLAHRALSSST